MKDLFRIFLSGLFVCFASAESQTYTNAMPESPRTDARRWTPVYFSLMVDEDQKWMAPTEPFDVYGLAIGPVLTGVPGTVAGVSISGLATAVEEQFFGVEIAGLAQFGQIGYGAQIALGGNAFNVFYGIQFAGIANVASGGGLQLAIGVNETDDAFNLGDKLRDGGRESEWSGLQLSVIGNRACYLDGVQFSLCYNYAVRCRGLQVALRNDAEELHGAQIGLINTARTGTGVQIGLINTFGTDQDRLVLPFLNARF